MQTFERHLYVILLWISTGVSFFAHVSTSTNAIAVAVALIAAMVLWVHAIHKVHSWENDVANPGTVVVTIGLIAAFTALTFLDASYLFMLFGLFTFLFGYSTEVRTPALLSALLTFVWIGAWIFHGLPLGAVATPIFVWGVANGINVLSTRISTQNTERGELIERLNATRDELAIAERERGVLEERQRISREIHDTLAQGFTSVVLLCEAMQKQIDTLPPEQLQRSLALLSSTARENLDEARRLITDQSPVVLDDRSLDRALELLAANLRRQTGALVDVHAPENSSFGGSEDVVLLRIAQEACNNIAKYAEAENVSIELSASNGLAQLTITDDGRGFDTDQARDSTTDELSGGNGMEFMSQRAHELDGTFAVTSKPGEGTTIVASVPIVENTP